MSWNPLLIALGLFGAALITDLTLGRSLRQRRRVPHVAGHTAAHENWAVQLHLIRFSAESTPQPAGPKINAQPPARPQNHDLPADVAIPRQSENVSDENCPAPVAAATTSRDWGGLRTVAILAIGLVLLTVGQNELLAPGGASAALSQWLNTQLRLDILNLDQVLGGLPLMLLGGILSVSALRNLPWLAADSTAFRLSPSALALRHVRADRRWVLVGMGLMALLLAQLAAKLYGAQAVALWLAVLGLFGVIAWRWDRRSGARLSPGMQRVDWLIILGLLLAGLVVGVYRLKAWPDMLMGDEGTFYTTARDIASGAYKPPIFDFGVYTYPILSSIYQALILKLFGASLWSWRFASVVAGTAAVVPLYLLTREWFGRRVAVAAGIAMLTLPYYLAFARLGYNNIQTLFPITLASYFLYLGLNRNSALYLYLGGTAVGLGFYTYTAARSALPIALLFLGLLLVQQRHLWRRYLIAGAILMVGVALVALPHLVYGVAISPSSADAKLLESSFFTVDFGRQFFSDAELFAVAPPFVVGGMPSFFNPRLYGILLTRGLVRSVAVFQLSGLVNEHFIAGPLAGAGSVSFYVLGLGVLLVCLRQRRFQYLGLWFLVTILTLSAANTFPPRHQHIVGLIPVLAVLIGLGAVAVVEVFWTVFPRVSRSAVRLTLGLLLLVMVGANLFNYFVTVRNVYWPDLEQIIAWNALYASDRSIVYAYHNSNEAGFRPFMISELLKNTRYSTVLDEALATGASALDSSGRWLVFFPEAARTAVLGALQSQWPGKLQTVTFYNREGHAIGGVASGQQLDSGPATSFYGTLSESYGGPVLVPILALVGLIALPFLFNRKWLARAPAWVLASLDWLGQAPVTEPDPIEPAGTRRMWPGEAWLRGLLRRAESVDGSAAEQAVIAPALLMDAPMIAPEAAVAEDSASSPTAAVAEQPADPPNAVALPAEAFVPASTAEPARPPLIEIEFKIRVNSPWRSGPSSRRPERSAGLPRSAPAPPRAAGAADLPSPSSGFAVWLADGRQRFAALGAAVRQYGLLPVLGLGAAWLAWSGHSILASGPDIQQGLTYLLAGSLLFLVSAALLEAGRPTPAVPAASVTARPTYWVADVHVRRLLIGAAVLLGLTAIARLITRGRDDSYWDIFGLWLLSVGLYVAAFIPAGRLPRWRVLQGGRGAYVLLLAIVLLAAALRFHGLGAWPPFMENDEATVGTQALSVLEGTLHNMFGMFTSVGTMYLFTMTVPVKLFGQTRFAIRLLSAVAGLLTIPLLARLAARLFGDRVALISAALLAAAHFHLQFSHISATTSAFDALFAVLSLLLVYEALQRQSLFTWALAGAVLAVGLYFYVGTRLLTVIVGLYLALLLVVNRRLLLKNLKGLLVFAGAYLIAAAPMGLLAVRDPASFMSRINQVGILENGWLASEMVARGWPAWRVLAEQFVNAFLIFNHFTPAWFYGATVPMLGPATGALFVLGLVYALPRLRDPRYLLLSVWFWVTLFGGQVLMIDPAPNAYRTMTLLPAVIVMAGLALTRLSEMLVAAWQNRFWQRAALAGVVLVVALEMAWNVHYYFDVWNPATEYSDSNSRMASLLGDYLGGLPPGAQAYVVDAPGFQAKSWQSIKFLAHGTSYVDAPGPVPETLPGLAPGVRAAFVFVFARAKEWTDAQQRYPGGQHSDHYLGPDLYFATYEVTVH